MHRSKYQDTDLLATIVTDHWRGFINKKSSERVMEDTLRTNILTDDQLMFYVLYDKCQYKISISLVNDTDSADKWQVYYQITLSDNTKESIAFAIDSILDYAKEVMLCKVTENDSIRKD